MNILLSIHYFKQFSKIYAALKGASQRFGNAPSGKQKKN